MLYLRIVNEDGTISFHPLRENNIYVHCETCGSMIPVDDPINFIADIRRRNKGELPMYLVDEMFEPLVSEEDYQKALEIRQQRAEQFPNNQDNLTAFSGKVKCGYCGCGVSRRTSGGRKRWVCNTRERKGMKQCECRPIWETELTAAGETVLGDSFDESVFSKEM